MKTTQLLIEIGLEELPAIPFLKEQPFIESKWNKILQDNECCVPFQFYSTPRRLCFIHDNFPLKQETKTVEFFGPPYSVAYKEGVATPAAESFAKKCGVSLEQITTTLKDNKEVLYFSCEQEGQETAFLLESMIATFLSSLSFGKAMRWGRLSQTFIRPIRWLCVMMDDTVVAMNIYGVESTATTRPHRSISFDAIAINHTTEYEALLKEGKVIIDPQERRESILNAFIAIEQSQGFCIERDDELLDEVVAITEYPQVLVGTFDESFLMLPPEVIITSMKINQRYFPIFKNGVLTHHFVVVSNAPLGEAQEIIRGNEKVLRARLSDALFFYHNDTAKKLSIEPLKNVVYVEGLGSVYQKALREKAIGAILSELVPHLHRVHLEQALTLAKADLCSEMVYEFTELQGIVGYYYALKQGEHQDVALAIKEQYLPEGENSPVASTLMGAICALAIKIDSLWALFSIGKIPSGSKDPFALRRAALGIIRTVIEHKIPLNITTLATAIQPLYKDFDDSSVKIFIKERFIPFFGDINPSIITACLDEDNLLILSQKIQALHRLSMQETFRENFVTFKRVANISKDINLEDSLDVNPEWFENAEEHALWNSFSAIEFNNDFDTYLSELFNLKGGLELFFEKCMVNAPDDNLRTNRKHLIARIYKALKTVADIKDISL